MEGLSRVRFTNLDKVLYPELGVTKKDVVMHYIKAAPKMLPLLRDRPLTVTRFPDGTHGEGFYMKDAPMGTPEWVKTHTRFSESAGRDTSYIVCNDLDTLLWLANLAALEIHVPLSRAPDTSQPDLVLFDLDPEPPAGWREVKQAALLVRGQLEEVGLRCYVKTSGKKGLHVVAPIESVYSFSETRSFAYGVGVMLAERHGFIVSERSQTHDPGTVLIDYPQNSERSTMVAPYSLRASREASVSTPLEWGELDRVMPFDHNIFNASSRSLVPWWGLWDSPQRLPF